jgi:hypothetical protein
MRVISAGIPEGTFVTFVDPIDNEIVLSQAATASNPTDVIIPPMGGQSETFAYSLTAPVAVEFAYPTYGPSLSHWGTSVIMDGQYDEDESLIFTYGQRGIVSIPANGSRALFSIRIAPSVDNGIPAAFGARELINRAQLKLLNIGVSTRSTGTNYLVRAYLNGIPSATVNWGSPTAAEPGTANSSFAQIADYIASGNVTLTGGEVVGGFLSQGTDSIDLSKLRPLGNSVLGGGGNTSNSGVYPDGPDTLTIVVTNFNTTTATFSGRVSWTEAQA